MKTVAVDVVKDVPLIVDRLPLYIKADEAIVNDVPGIVADVTSVISAAVGGGAILTSIEAAIASLGTNPAADLAAVTSILAQAPSFGAYVTNLKAKLTVLLTDLGADEKEIAAIFATPSPVTATPVLAPVVTQQAA